MTAAPILTVALTSLRNGFNIAFPLRDKASDGWIGDAAHQAETSGHNPDDTAGVSAEYSDVDTIAEVRAIDVDADLRAAPWTMMDVIRVVLATPNDTRRLRYIIHNETVWSKSEGWLPRKYTGANPHTMHAHFSGDPLYDNDGSVWSVQLLGDSMYSEAQMKAFPWQYTGGGIDAESTLKALNMVYRETQGLKDAVAKLQTTLDSILATLPALPVAHVHETGPALPVTAPES